MAKVTVQIEIDTEEGTMDVSINGTSIPNATSVYCNKYYNSYEEENKVTCSVSATEENEETGIIKMTNFYTDSSEKAREIPQSQAIKTLAGFIGVETKDHTNSLSDYLLKKLSR